MPIGHRGPAGGIHDSLISKNNVTLKASLTSGDGTPVLEQLSNTNGSRGLSMHSSSCVSVLAGRAVFLSPKEWSRCYSAFKIAMKGGVTVTVGLRKDRFNCWYCYYKGRTFAFECVEWNRKYDSFDFKNSCGQCRC